MAVYTPVTPEEAQQLLDTLALGTLTHIEPCKGGIENTNYFIDSTEGRFVLTVFERLTFLQLPFFLTLMQHLARQGLPVPGPRASAEGQILFAHRGKPCALVARLEGASQLDPQAAHCQALGTLLAQLHVAAADAPILQPHLRGHDWWQEIAPQVMPHLPPEQAALLQDELDVQAELWRSPLAQLWPRGPVHNDLFRDNAMFVDDTISGVFDFYFAGVEAWLFDLCVCLNDWCIDRATGELQQEKAQALLSAYEAVRPLTPSERAAMPRMLRAAALRFWLSRLADWHAPREAHVLQPHDPGHFERVLRARREGR
jgi:homoserine kinase type II